MDNKERWIMFYLNGKELGGYTVYGTFKGELESTKELFAAEHGVTPDMIEAREVLR